LRASVRAESEATVARQSEEGIISIVSSSAQGEQTHARDVGSYSLRQWLEEGSQGCICAAGVQSPCLVAGEYVGRNGGRSSKKLLKELLQERCGALSGPGYKGRLVGFGWEEEVKPFFQQLWNIPQHPT
jgi:hypothetical protein